MSSDLLSIRKYRPGDEQGIVDLLNTVFAEDDSNHRPRTLAEWRWEYEQNPAGMEVVVAAEATGRIVAHYACIPYRIVLDGREARCGQGVDSMVAADYRRGLKSQGAFVRTAAYYFDKYGVPEVNAYGYGFPNKKALRLGIRILKYMPVHAPVLTLGCNLFARAEVLDGADGVGKSGSSELRPLAVERFDGRMDRLWQRLQAQPVSAVKMGIIRDQQYMNWRYLDCPRAPYRAFAMADGEGEWHGLYVSREDWTGPPILALAEFLVPGADAAVAEAMARHAVAQARARGQQRLEVWFPPWHALFEVLQACGFVAEESPFNLCVKIYEEEISEAWVQQNWYYGIGDTDVF